MPTPKPHRWEQTRFKGEDARLLVKDRCALCGEVRPLTFEHVPPRSTGNCGPGVGYSGPHYLHRLGGGSEPLLGSGFKDGSGKVALCHDCNGSTAKWYMAEFKRWCKAGIDALDRLDSPLVRDRRPQLERVTLVVSDADPLAFMKQAVGLLMTTVGPSFGDRAPELRRFVLDPQAPGMPNGFRLYLTLCSGPLKRWSGLAGLLRAAEVPPLKATVCELAFKPFALLLSVETDWEALSVGEITHLAEVPRGKPTNLDIVTDAGFSHGNLPGDYRSSAMMKVDMATSAREGIATDL